MKKNCVIYDSMDEPKEPTLSEISQADPQIEPMGKSKIK